MNQIEIGIKRGWTLPHTEKIIQNVKLQWKLKLESNWNWNQDLIKNQGKIEIKVENIDTPKGYKINDPKKSNKI